MSGVGWSRQPLLRVSGVGWSTQLLLCGSGWDGADSCGHAVCE